MPFQPPPHRQRSIGSFLLGNERSAFAHQYTRKGLIQFQSKLVRQSGKPTFAEMLFRFATATISAIGGIGAPFADSSGQNVFKNYW
jgi:hypothetical protein